MPPTSRPTPRIDRCLELLLIALLVFLPAAFGTVDAWSELAAVVVVGVMAVLLAARYAIGRERIFPSWIILAPIGLFVAIVLVQLVPLPPSVIHFIAPQTFELKNQLLSDLPDAPSALSRMTVTFYALATRHDLRIVLFAVTILATTLAITRDDRRRLRLLAAITLIGIAAAILALAQDLTHTTSIYWRIPLGELAKNGPFANHSHYGQFMNLSIGAAIALLLMLVTKTSSEATPSRWRWIAATAIAGGIVLGWATIALSLTRGGVIAGAVAGCLVMATLLTFKNFRRLGLMIGVIAVAAAALLLHFGASQIVARMQTPDVAKQRIQMNHDTFEMAAAHPSLGVGLGNFEWVFPMYDRAVDLSKAAYADNDYLQTLSEMGSPAMAFVAIFLALVWWHWFGALRRGEYPNALIAVGLGYGLLTAMIHGISDFGQHLPANACLSSITCGMLLNLGSNKKSPTTKPICKSKAIVMAITVAIFGTWSIADAARSWAADSHWIEARHVAHRLERQNWVGDADDISRLREETDAAVTIENGNAYYRYRRAVYDWRLAVQQFDRGSAELAREAQRVVDQLNGVRALCPTYAPLYLILGQIEYAHLNREIGIAHLHTATRLQQNDPTIWFAAAKVDALRGDKSAAQTEIRKALALDYTVMNDIAELYLDDIHDPQPLIDLADGNYYRMYQIGNLLMARPQYRDLGAATYRRGIEINIEYARQNPTADNLAPAAFGAAEIQQFDIAQQFLATALKQEPSHSDWRLRRADALIRLGRLDEASQELDVIRRENPQEPQFAEIEKRLEAARAKP